MINRKQLFFLTGTFFLEGLIAFLSMWVTPVDPGRGNIIDYATLRLIMAGFYCCVLIPLLMLVLIMWRVVNWGNKFANRLDDLLVGSKSRLFLVQGVIIVLFIFLTECFLMSFVSFPVPMRSLFIWATLASFQVWLFFRIVYKEKYRTKQSMPSKIKVIWNNWLPIQRKTFYTIAGISLLYFISFIPINYLPDRNGNFNIHQDEEVLYPDVTQVFVPQDTVTGTIRNVLASWPWQYGYPYLTTSAAVLFIPSLIYGNQFAEQVQLNIFLLRQFISVLPLVLSMVLAIFLVTRFKSLKMSLVMFFFLACVPGIVKYNIGFWHADSLVLLFVMLAILALVEDHQRFGLNFYLAAVFCGLAAITKMWGLFFGPAIAAYLLYGLIKNRISPQKALLNAALFLLAMFASVIISSPSLMDPAIAKWALHVWLPMQGSLLSGYAPDATGEYNTGLMNWLKYFGFHYMKSYFYYFSMIALTIGSLRGSKVWVNRFLLGWCLVATIFPAYFIALKNYQYMLPAAVPLFCAAFLFPAVSDPDPDAKWGSFLEKPNSRKIIWLITIIMLVSQFIINLVILGLFFFRK